MSRYIIVFLLVVFVGCICNFAKASNAGVKKESSLSLTPPVQCYSCVSCPKVGKETPKKFCPHNPNPYRMKTCVTYIETYPFAHNGDSKKNVTYVIRGCASERGSCEDIRKAFAENNPFKIKLESCAECEGDYCNGVSRSIPGIFLAFFAVLLTPILAKYTLS